MRPARRRAVSAAVVAGTLLTLTGCVGEAERAADLGWYRPEPGRPWCDLLTDAQVDRLVGPGAPEPWQAPAEPAWNGSWTCTIAPDLRGRDGTGETPPTLLDAHTRLYPPRTPEVVAAGNYSPVDEGLEGELVARGDGLWVAEDLGLYVVRRPCGPKRGPSPPDDLEARMFVEPDRLPHGEAVGIVRRVWAEAADVHRCDGP